MKKHFFTLDIYKYWDNGFTGWGLWGLWAKKDLDRVVARANKEGFTFPSVLIFNAEGACQSIVSKDKTTYAEISIVKLEE